MGYYYIILLSRISWDKVGIMDAIMGSLKGNNNNNNSLGSNNNNSVKKVDLRHVLLSWLAFNSKTWELIQSFLIKISKLYSKIA